MDRNSGQSTRANRRRIEYRSHSAPHDGTGTLTWSADGGPCVDHPTRGDGGRQRPGAHGSVTPRETPIRGKIDRCSEERQQPAARARRTPPGAPWTLPDRRQLRFGGPHPLKKRCELGFRRPRTLKKRNELRLGRPQTPEKRSELRLGWPQTPEKTKYVAPEKAWGPEITASTSTRKGPTPSKTMFASVRRRPPGGGVNDVRAGEGSSLQSRRPRVSERNHEVRLLTDTSTIQL